MSVVYQRTSAFFLIGLALAAGYAFGRAHSIDTLSRDLDHQLRRSIRLAVGPLGSLQELDEEFGGTGSVDRLVESLEETVDDAVRLLAPGADLQGELGLETLGDQSYRKDVLALAKAYRSVFTSPWHVRESTEAILAGAAEPDRRLIHGVGPALRRVLGEDREALTSLWSGLGEGNERLVLQRSTDPGVLVVSLDAEGVQGRVRLYGDGRAVITEAGRQAREYELTLAPGELSEILRLVLVRGLLAMTSREMSGRGTGHGPFRILSTRASFGRLVIFLDGIEDPSFGTRLGHVVKAIYFREPAVGFPERPSGSPLAAVRSVAGQLLALTTREDLRLMGRPAVQHEPFEEVSVLFSGLQNNPGLWRSDGVSVHRLIRGEVGRFAASPDGRFVAVYGRSPLLWDLKKGESRRLMPEDLSIFPGGEDTAKLQLTEGLPGWWGRSRGAAIAPGESPPQVAFSSMMSFGTSGVELLLVRPVDSATGGLALGEPALVLAVQAFDFDWSPDGERLVYSQLRELWKVDTDGEQRTRLVNARAGCCSIGRPRWSPGGERILYLRSERFGGAGTGTSTGFIYVVDIDGGNDRYLGEGGWPQWVTSEVGADSP